jgi:hypothetical protein
VHDECLPEPQGHGSFNCTVAAAKSIQAGTDVDCGGVYTANMEQAVADGLLTQAEVDVSFNRLTSTVRVFRQKLTLEDALNFTPLLHFEALCLACAQWHSSRVFAHSSYRLAL